MASIWPWRKSAEKTAEDGNVQGRSSLHPRAGPSFSTPQPAAGRPLADVPPVNSASSKPDSASRADYDLQDPGLAKSTPLANVDSEGMEMFEAVEALEDFSTPLGSTPQYSTPQYHTPQYSTPLAGTPLGTSPGKYGQFFSTNVGSGSKRLGSGSYADVGAQLDAASKKLAADRPAQKGLAALLNGDADALTSSSSAEAGANRDSLNSVSPGVKASSGAAQLEGVAGGLQDLEEKLARISAQLDAKSDEGHAMQQSLQQMLQTLEEERAAAYSAARNSLKESLLRNRKERLLQNQGIQPGEGMKTHAATGAPTLGAAGRSQSYAIGGAADQRGILRGGDATPSLTGPAPALGLPAPSSTAAASGAPQRFQGPGQSTGGKAHGLAQQHGLGGVGPGPPQGAARRQTDLGSRGRQEMEAVGRFGRRPSAAAPMPWQQQQQEEGLLATVNEYQSIESRWERAQMGSCFMGFPSFGIGQRRTGQKAAKQQRWVVDSSWMEALRKEFMELHARLAAAEEQNQNLLQIQAAKAELEERVLRLIESQELHEEEVARVMSKLLELRAPALPATID